MNQGDQPIRWAAAAGLVILLVLGVWFRFYHLDRKVYGGDEIFTAWEIAGYTRDEAKDFRPLDALEWRRHLEISRDRRPTQIIEAFADHVTPPPLYFLGARWWAMWRSASVWDVRFFTAMISLLAFPCLYWLCVELFHSRLVAWTALGLLAVSPFHVLYAQEARPYSLWTVTTLLASAALLWAMRVGSGAAWALYGIASALGLYAQYLFALVMVGHGIYVVALSSAERRREVVHFGTAGILALLALAAWLIRTDKILPGSSTFTRRKISAIVFGERWLMNVSSVFFDPQVGRPGMLFDVYGRDIGLRWDEPSTYVILLVVGLVGWSLYALIRETPRSVWLFVYTLMGALLVFLAGPDLIKGGQRSTTGRYLVPIYIGIVLAVASCLANRIVATTASPHRRWAWRMVTVALVSVGVVSCWVSAQADTWWSKYGAYYQPEVARIINRSPSPLVLVSGPVSLFALSLLVQPGTTLQLAEQWAEPPMSRFSDVFVVEPLPQFSDAVAAQTRYRMTLIYKAGRLWRIEDLGSR